MGGQIVGVNQVWLLPPDQVPEPGARSEGSYRTSLIPQLEWTMHAAKAGPTHPFHHFIATAENHQHVMALTLKAQSKPLGRDFGASDERSDAYKTDLERPVSIT